MSIRNFYKQNLAFIELADATLSGVALAFLMAVSDSVMLV